MIEESGGIKEDFLISIPGIGTVSYAQLEKAVRRDDYLASLKSFIFAAWRLVEPMAEIEWNWHLDEFCTVLELVYRGEIKRLIVNVPPGSSKSLIFSVFFNAWVWANNPSARFLTASYTVDLTIRDNIRLRSIILSSWYMDLFPDVRLSSDQNAKERFDTVDKGWRIASSVEGVATGEHPNYIIIDDPLKVNDARSEVKRRAANNWIDGTISTRTRLDPAIILVMQRLHEDDPSGHLLSKGGWNHLCFPMHYQTTKKDTDPRNIPDPRDKRTIPGELLWPKIWSEEKIAKAELLLGTQAGGQLDQNPIPDGGLLYDRDWFEIIESIPEEVEECRGWDIAQTDAGEKNSKNANLTVGTKLGKGRRTGLIYVIDNIRVQKTFVDDLIKNTAKMDGVHCRIREGSGSGKATIKARTTLLSGYDYASSPETASSGDKIQRNNPFRAQAQARNVKILRGEWNEVYLSVICSFPLGKCDDDIDSTSNAANELFGTEEEWFTFGG